MRRDRHGRPRSQDARLAARATAAAPSYKRSESTAYALALAGGKLVFRAGNGTAWTELVGPAVTNGQWHYVAAEWDVDTVHLWLDGMEVATMPITFFIGVPSNATYIGGMPGDAYFGGAIDELRVSLGRRGTGITTYYATATSCQ